MPGPGGRGPSTSGIRPLTPHHRAPGRARTRPNRRVAAQARQALQALDIVAGGGALSPQVTRPRPGTSRSEARPGLDQPRAVAVDDDGDGGVGASAVTACSMSGWWGQVLQALTGDSPVSGSQGAASSAASARALTPRPAPSARCAPARPPGRFRGSPSCSGPGAGPRTGSEAASGRGRSRARSQSRLQARRRS